MHRSCTDFLAGACTSSRVSSEWMSKSGPQSSLKCSRYLRLLKSMLFLSVPTESIPWISWILKVLRAQLRISRTCFARGRPAPVSLFVTLASIRPYLDGYSELRDLDCTQAVRIGLTLGQCLSEACRYSTLRRDPLC